MDVIPPDQFKEIKKWKLGDRIFYLLLNFLVTAITAYGVSSYVSFNVATSQINNQSMYINGQGPVLGVQNDNTANKKNDTQRKILAGEFNVDDWDIEDARIFKNDDFYCVKKLRNFRSYDILYEKNKIIAGSDIKVKYLLRDNKEGDGDKRLILSFGEKRDYSFLLPDRDSRFIRFDDASDNYQDRNFELKGGPVNTSEEAMFEVKFENPATNYLNFSFTYTYFTSEGDKEQLEYKGTHTIRSGWIGSDNMSIAQELRIGTEQGSCFKIINFEAR